MMSWYDDGWTGGWVVLGLMAIFWVALVGVAIWAAVHLLRRESPTANVAPTAPSPRAILDRRLAAGEIDAEQYAQLRRLLEGHTASGAATDAPAHP